ncbi:hypothetical protein Bbelb_375880 [Branchiostoma belcheri]|nr:hypothetical protein Bbelb_375880 [Branchiostoma belcheri]
MPVGLEHRDRVGLFTSYVIGAIGVFRQAVPSGTLIAAPAQCDRPSRRVVINKGGWIVPQHRRGTGKPAVVWPLSYPTDLCLERRCRMDMTLSWFGRVLFGPAVVFPRPAQRAARLRKDSEKIRLERGARQGDNISSNLFSACLQEAVINKIDWDQDDVTLIESGLITCKSYVQEKADEYQIPLCVIFVDYEKAFDSISFGHHHSRHSIALLENHGATSTLRLKGSENIRHERGAQEILFVSAGVGDTDPVKDTGEPAVVWLPGYSTPSTVEIPGSLRWSGCQTSSTPSTVEIPGSLRWVQYSQHRRDTGEPTVVWLPCEQYQHRRDIGEPTVVWLPGYSTPSTVEIPGSPRWSGYQATVLPTPPDLDTDCEVLWTQTQLAGRKPLIIGTYYRPPSDQGNSLDELDRSIGKMGAKINSDNVIILGDFNTPGIKWDTTVADNSQAYTGQAEKLLNLMDNHGLFQTVQEPTRNGNLLDLVLVNNPNIIEKTTVVPGISDHDMVLVDVNLALKQNRKPKRKVYIRTKADEPAIKKDLTDYATNFHKRTQDMSVTQKWSDFKDKMKDTMNKHIPSKITSSRYNLPWFNRNLRRHCREKQRLYNKAKKTGQEEDWNKYKRVKKGVQKSIRQAHSKYVADILGEAIVDKPKTFWSYIKGLRKDLVGVAPLKVGNTIISDSGKKAEVLSSQFKSVFTEEDTTDMPSLGQPCTPPMEHIVVSTDGVEKMLQGLNPSKASGPDQIPPWFLKLTASEIAPVLTNIFQHSLNTAEIPKDWRDANICAIFKKGDRAVPSNYRPVSLTCISCKLLEHIIHSQIMKHLESYSILTDYQHGFRAKRSTETQLILTVHDIAGALNSKRQVDLAILDFTKAFDKVPHGRLISKLEYYGIQGPTLNWLKAFLTNREQTVVVEGKASAPVKVASGVPQGTVLGPLLFLLYINDLPDQLDSNVRLFADDCLLYVELSTQTDSQLLQKDLNTLEEWQSKWLMQFNPEKCYIMHITNKRTPHATSYQFCGQALATTKIHPYLGVTLTSGLKWGAHSYVIGAIGVFRQAVPSGTLIAAPAKCDRPSRGTREPAVVWLPGYSTPSTVEIPGSLRWSGYQATVLPAPYRYEGACGGLATRLQYSQHSRDTGEPAVVWLPGYSTPSTVEIPGSLRWSGYQATVLPVPLQYSQHRRDTGEPAVVWLPGYSTPSTVDIPGSLRWSGYQANSTPSTVDIPGSLRWSGYQATVLPVPLQYSQHRRDTGEPAVVWLPGYSTPSTVEIPGSLRWSGIQATVLPALSLMFADDLALRADSARSHDSQAGSWTLTRPREGTETRHSMNFDMELRNRPDPIPSYVIGGVGVFRQAVPSGALIAAPAQCDRPSRTQARGNGQGRVDSAPSTVERYRGAYGGLAARLQYSQHSRDTGEPAVVWLPGYSTPSTVDVPGSLRWSGCQATVLPAP